MSGLSIQQILHQLRTITGHDTISLPDSDTGEQIGGMTYINTSFWEIANKFNFRQEDATVGDITIIGQSAYPCPTLMDAVTDVSILDPSSNKYTKLDQMTLSVYRDSQDIDDDARGFPTSYVRNGSAYILYPTPDQVYTTQIDYLQTLADVILAGTPIIPREWHEIITYGAAWRVFAGLNGDIVRTQFYTNLQTRLMNTTASVQAKEEMDYSNAGLNVRGRSYE